ncbi:MAG: LamG-like jellyroll fold domain-containing protein [Cyclobacteriaceae bacterium]
MKRFLRATFLCGLSISIAFITSCNQDDDFINTDPEIEDQSFLVDENSVVGTIVGTVVASDVNTDQSLSFSIISGNTNVVFQINNSGVLSIANSEFLDYEESTSYQLTVEVGDDFTVSGTAQAVVTINVNDVNESHSVADQSFSVYENTNGGSIVGNVLVEDVEDGSFTFSILSGNSNDAFTISNEGVIMLTSACILDKDIISSYSLGISVDDVDFSIPATLTIDVDENSELVSEGLVAYYPFNGNALDESTNAFDGTVTNATLTSDRFGCDNKAYSFDTIDDIIETSTDIDQNLANGVTFSIWLNPSQLDVSQVFISNYSGLGAEGNCNGRIGFYLRIESDNAVAIRYATDGNDFIGIKSAPSTIQSDVWQHVVFTWDGVISTPGFDIYLNGNSLSLESAGGGFIGCTSSLIESTDPFRFGYHQCAAGPCQPFEGKMDDIRIYSRVLTESEITILAEE